MEVDEDISFCNQKTLATMTVAENVDDALAEDSIVIKKKSADTIYYSASSHDDVPLLSVQMAAMSPSKNDVLMEGTGDATSSIDNKTQTPVMNRRLSNFSSQGSFELASSSAMNLQKVLFKEANDANVMTLNPPEVLLSPMSKPQYSSRDMSDMQRDWQSKVHLSSNTPNRTLQTEYQGNRVFAV